MRTITRRSAPGLLAAFAGAFTTGLAGRCLAADELDPVFAALTRFEREQAAWQIAHKHEEALTDSDRDTARAGRVQIGNMTILDQDHPDCGVTKPVFLYSEVDIERQYAGPFKEERCAALLAAFRDDKERQAKRQLESGLTDAERLANEAFQRRQDAESAALRTVPTTFAGGLALAQFAMERIKDGLSDSDETAFVETMLAYFASCQL
jgi:hypothetical protein